MAAKTLVITVQLSEEQYDLLKQEADNTGWDNVEMLMETTVADRIHHVIEWGSDTVDTEFSVVAKEGT